jgi:hypothetical protein
MANDDMLLELEIQDRVRKQISMNRIVTAAVKKMLFSLGNPYEVVNTLRSAADELARHFPEHCAMYADASNDWTRTNTRFQNTAEYEAHLKVEEEKEEEKFGAELSGDLFGADTTTDLREHIYKFEARDPSDL